MSYMYRLVAATLLISGFLEATPSSIFFTNCTTSIQDTGTALGGIFNYFGVRQKYDNDYFAPDIGFEYGLFGYGKLKCEAGIDYLGGVRHPWVFNIKAGYPDEGILFPDCPSFNVALYDVGNQPNYSNFNIVQFIVGKKLGTQPMTVYASYYFGNRNLGPDRSGFMGAIEYKMLHETFCDGVEFNRLILYADFATGKNAIGGCGVGLCYFFSPIISLLTGPVFYSDASINGGWKWSTQLSFDIPVPKCEYGLWGLFGKNWGPEEAKK